MHHEVPPSFLELNREHCSKQDNLSTDNDQLNYFQLNVTSYTTRYNFYKRKEKKTNSHIYIYNLEMCLVHHQDNYHNFVLK